MTQPELTPQSIREEQQSISTGKPPTRHRTLLWPNSSNQLRNAHLNPDDFTPIRSRFTPTGIDLTDPRCAQVLALSRQAADLLDKRAQLLSTLQPAMPATATPDTAELQATYAIPAEDSSALQRDAQGAIQESSAEPHVSLPHDNIQQPYDESPLSQVASTTRPPQAQHLTQPLQSLSDTQSPQILQAQQPLHTAHPTKTPQPLQAAPSPQAQQSSQATQLPHDAQTTQPPHIAQPPQTQQPTQAAQSPRVPQSPQPPQTQQPLPTAQFAHSAQALPPASQSQTSSVQVLLLVLGVSLTVLAVAAFASLAHFLFGDIGRAACIGIAGVIALVASFVMAQRLRVTAEGLAWVGLVAIAIDADLIGSIIADSVPSLRGTVTGGLILAAILTALGLHLLSTFNKERPLRAWSLYIALTIAPTIAMLTDIPLLPRYGTDALAGVCLVALAAVDCLVPRLARIPERIIALTLTSILLTAIALSGFDTSQTPRVTVGFGAYLAMLILTAAVWMRDAARTASLPTAVPTSSLTSPIMPYGYPVPVRGDQPSQAPTFNPISPPTAAPSSWPPTVPSAPPMPPISTMPTVPPVAPSTLNAAISLPSAARKHNPETAMRWIMSAFTTIVALSMAALADDATPPFDLIFALFGAMMTIVGWYWMRMRPWLRSWPALGPGLLLMLVPPWLMTLSHVVPPMPRAPLLFALALAVLLVGARLGWQAPVILGAIMLITHTLTQLWPWIALISTGFWWIWLLLAGIILIAAAARYESGIRSMKSLARRIAQLR